MNDSLKKYVLKNFLKSVKSFYFFIAPLNEEFEQRVHVLIIILLFNQNSLNQECTLDIKSGQYVCV